MTQKDYQECCHASARQVYTRLKNVNATTVNGVKFYPLPDVLAGLPDKYAYAVPALLARAVEDTGETVVGGRVDLPATEALERFLIRHVHGAAFRIAHIRREFFDGLAQAVKSSGWVADAEVLRVLILRDGGCLAYAITGNPSTVPENWAVKARIFALLHTSEIVA
ncbi:hypothetical protein GVY41_18995 [Frigidibacter albus]|uniref:Uncharacterized protein n=1 Tax=Frigidibacter albus TaxID=1465486 RepID=A0A6L8VLS1_9RHOB|nr:hypothetical protein [Frigidibacter albus]MZQ91163.1 hypothetical protein [Frigidibacter albus]NBE33089.1 hypothetical protein [Frigidibacter albus]